MNGSTPHRPPDGVRRLSFFAMGTTCEIQFVCEEPLRATAFEKAALAWVATFEAKYSRFRENSLVSRINASAGGDWVVVDADLELMLKLCDTLYTLTQGVLDPTALPLMRLWNYKAEHPVIPPESAIAAARRLVGWPKVQRMPGRVRLPEVGMALDFGGFGKEYAVDMVASLAQEHGIANVLVDFGHDLRGYGAPPGKPAWHIGLENPRQAGQTDGSVALGGGRGIASSGDYVRRFMLGGRRYGHIIDPRTGWPVANGCMQSTVVAATCLHAGVLSTTSFVLGVPLGINFIESFPGAEGLMVTDKLRAQTRGFFNYVVT
jgi:thiamine biosynthesis lipoprotein